MKVLIGITGSIAIYKTCELIRLFIKMGDEVKVVMSESAAKFITPLTFEALTRNKVLIEKNEDWSSELNHIDYAKWADIYIIAPATANTINKAANGIADNLLLQTYLATKAPVLFAPAANTNMYLHPTTQSSFKK
ncbi:MAG: flavoprotein, partial [Nautiliaceae bacterium]